MLPWECKGNRSQNYNYVTNNRIFYHLTTNNHLSKLLRHILEYGPWQITLCGNNGVRTPLNKDKTPNAHVDYGPMFGANMWKKQCQIPVLSPPSSYLPRMCMDILSLPCLIYSRWPQKLLEFGHLICWLYVKFTDNLSAIKSAVTKHY